MWEQMLVKEPESYVPEPAGPTYIVKPGDKLVDIATKHNMAYARLKKLNGLTVDYVAPGRVLKLA
nr:LysM peptidoglycan-binding domain-containing protein [Weissella cibaria]